MPENETLLPFADRTRAEMVKRVKELGLPWVPPARSFAYAQGAIP